MSTISVIIPALNEERSLESSVYTIYEAIKISFDDYEIIIFDDGSTDKTGEIADNLAKIIDKVRVIHHERPLCLGGVFKYGIRLSKMDYLIRINGKNDINKENLLRIFSLCGQADLIIPYQLNSN